MADAADLKIVIPASYLVMPSNTKQYLSTFQSLLNHFEILVPTQSF